MTDQDLVVSLLKAPPLHGRVDGVLLPLSVRQNRVEDIFLDFLEWLRPITAPKASTKAASQTASARAELVAAQIKANGSAFSMNLSKEKEHLVRRWISSELVVTSQATNWSKQANAVSFVPLHAAVADHFPPGGQPPAYGRFTCELLSLGRENPAELLTSMGSFFGSSGGDPVARIVEGALETLSEEEKRKTPKRFSNVLEGNEGRRLVYSVRHASLFQGTIKNILHYSSTTSRQTFVGWLYAVLTFFLATYFLRTASAARALASWLESVSNNSPVSWNLSIDDAEFAPTLPYGRRNTAHAALMKRFPSYTSQIMIAAAFRELLGLGSVRRENLSEMAADLAEALRHASARPTFQEVLSRYPIDIDGDEWKLKADDKARLLNVAATSQISPFVAVAQLLNFEDMARRSNNVMEWQFYSSLALHPLYGFARRGRTRDILRYELSDNLATALVHSHIVDFRDEATFATFLAYLTTLGFSFDNPGREALERQLTELGMLEGLSDASDAKYLSTLYAVGDLP